MKPTEDNVANQVMAATEEYYEKMKQVRDQTEKERQTISGTTKRGMELDEFLAKINSVINALTPLYRRT